MERMEVDPCACAASGGGVLRRSNSAPMITSVSDGSVVFGSSARFRRSSVSVNSSGPSQLLPLSSMPLMTERTEAKRHEDLGVGLRGSLQRLSWSSLSSTPAAPHRSFTNTNTWSPTHDSGVTPNSSPSPTRRFRPSVRLPVVPLKRKGGVESDAPPKKLFVAGVSEPQRNFSVSVSSEASDAPPPRSAPPSFSFSPHQH